MIYQLEYSQLAVEETIRLHTRWKVPSFVTRSWLEIIKHLASWRDASQLEGRWIYLKRSDLQQIKWITHCGVLLDRWHVLSCAMVESWWPLHYLNGFNGFYDLPLPNSTVSLHDWSDIFFSDIMNRVLTGFSNRSKFSELKKFVWCRRKLLLPQSNTTKR